MATRNFWVIKAGSTVVTYTGRKVSGESRLRRPLEITGSWREILLPDMTCEDAWALVQAIDDEKTIYLVKATDIVCEVREVDDEPVPAKPAAVTISSPRPAEAAAGTGGGWWVNKRPRAGFNPNCSRRCIGGWWRESRTGTHPCFECFPPTGPSEAEANAAASRFAPVTDEDGDE